MCCYINDFHLLEAVICDVRIIPAKIRIEIGLHAITRFIRNVKYGTTFDSKRDHSAQNQTQHSIHLLTLNLFSSIKFQSYKTMYKISLISTKLWLVQEFK